MRLGKVVKSNSHCDYIVQLDDAMDFIGGPPRAEDYGFGTFVKLEDNHNRHWAVGLIYNSQLLNPAFNSLGPRLSSEPDPLFTPDLINETRTLLWTVLVGNFATDRAADENRSDAPTTSDPITSDPTTSDPTTSGRYGIQGIPRVVVPVNTPVYAMSNAEIHQFHQDRQGRSQFTYYSHLLKAGGTFAAQLTHQVLEELVAANCFQGSEQRALSVLSRELAWKNTMGVMR
jgi:hypothetical protein